MEFVWKVLTWLSIVCGLATYFIGWLVLLTGSDIWIPTAFWFYDAISAGVFAVFFLLWGVHGKD